MGGQEAHLYTCVHILVLHPLIKKALIINRDARQSQNHLAKDGPRGEGLS